MNSSNVKYNNGITKKINFDFGKNSQKNDYFSKREQDMDLSDFHVGKRDGRGRKTFVFWTLIFLLLVLAVGNLILTLTILGVLRLGYGMNSLELVPEALAIKFYGNTDLGHLYKIDGKINGFLDSALEINGDDDGSLQFNLVGRNSRPISKLSINRTGTFIHNIDNFVIKGGNENRHIFSTRSPHFNMPKSVKNLAVKLVHTNRMLSLNNSSLEIQADRFVNLRGTEGTRMESREVIWSADQDIYLKSVNGSIIFSGKEGVSIDMKNIPTVPLSSNDQVVTQFKLCVCIPHGKLFRLPILQGQSTRISCSHVKMTPSYNPCT